MLTRMRTCNCSFCQTLNGRTATRPCSSISQIAVIMVLLARLVHWQPALAGVVTTVVLVPITAIITRKAAHVRKRLIGLTDARVKVCTEVVSGGLLLCALPVKYE